MFTFILVHSGLTNVKNTRFDLKYVLVNVEININQDRKISLEELFTASSLTNVVK